MRILEKNILEIIKLIKSLKYSSFLVEKSINKIHYCLRNGGKILICGNGGSAADANHFVTEFLIRLRPRINRQPYPILSLAQDTSVITACGNDYKFEDIFLRTFKAYYKTNDILIVLSTSGDSKNILKLLKYTNVRKICTIAFLGNRGGKSKSLCSVPIIINSKKPDRVQESYKFLLHHIFEQVENMLINKNKKNY
jgi:D-sedoheptulose 7-phosphate isomerase